MPSPEKQAQHIIFCVIVVAITLGMPLCGGKTKLDQENLGKTLFFFYLHHLFVCLSFYVYFCYFVVLFFLKYKAKT